jgi:hypothetical protein
VHENNPSQSKRHGLDTNSALHSQPRSIDNLTLEEQAFELEQKPKPKPKQKREQVFEPQAVTQGKANETASTPASAPHGQPRSIDHLTPEEHVFEVNRSRKAIKSRLYGSIARLKVCLIDIRHC